MATPARANADARLRRFGRDLTETLGTLKGVAGHLKTLHGLFLPILGGASAVLPMVGDFLRPLAPFNFIAFLLALLVAGVLLYLVQQRGRATGLALGGACLVALFLTVGFGGWWVLALVGGGGKNKGFIAGKVGFMDRLQAATVAPRTSVQTVDTSKLVEEELARRSEEERRHDADQYAAALLEKTFEDFPEKVLEARVIGDFEQGERSGSDVKVQVKVRFEINEKAYDEQLERLQKRLEKVALRKGEFTMIPTREGKHTYVVPEKLEGDPRVAAREGRLVLLNTHRTAENRRTEWKFYVVPEACALSSLAEKAFSVKLSLLGEGGRLVAVDRFPAKQKGSDLSPLFYYHGRETDTERHTFYNRSPFQGGVLLIAPFFFFVEHGTKQTQIGRWWYLEIDTLGFLSQAEETREIPLALDELRNVKSVKCELLPR